MLISDAVVRLQTESNKTTLPCRPEGISEEPNLQEEEGPMKLLEALAPSLVQWRRALKESVKISQNPEDLLIL